MTQRPNTSTPDSSSFPSQSTLRARRLGIDTLDHAIIYMRSDCHICRAEGFTSHARIKVTAPGNKVLIATLNLVTSDLLAPGDIGLSETAWLKLGLQDGAQVELAHPAPLNSLSAVRSKIYGKVLDQKALDSIIGDVSLGKFSDIHLSAFLTASAAHSQDASEVLALTRAMVKIGKSLDWSRTPIIDKHCVGGLPGNRTTPIVVAICVAAGLTMPKTSSRAITSPAGTADTMETLAPVELSLAAMRRVVESVGGCIVWGGAVALSPVDDVFIRIERALDIDSDGQLVASVLSKKVAAGSSHLVIDMPVGTTAKVRSKVAADRLGSLFKQVSNELGLNLRVIQTDGSQPVGRGIGPALEARDVLAVLTGSSDRASDLETRAIRLAGELLESGNAARAREGVGMAADIIASGRAWRAFQSICDAQGGMRVPPIAAHQHPVETHRSGRVASIDNRRLAKAAKLAGAPASKAAGIDLHVSLGSVVEANAPLFTVHAQTHGELSYALEYIQNEAAIISVEEAP